MLPSLASKTVSPSSTPGSRPAFVKVAAFIGRYNSARPPSTNVTRTEPGFRSWL
jgi:hypothetical protein